MVRINELIKSDIQKLNTLKKSNGFMMLLFGFFIRRSIRIIILMRLLKSNYRIISFLSHRILRRNHIEVGKSVEIGEGLFLPHPWCIIIAEDVKLGNDVSIGQYVTIGGNFKKTKKQPDGRIQKLPVIGNRVMIQPGAVIAGPVTIGNDVIIGANAVITHDIPSYSMVFGQNQIAKKKIRIPKKGGEFNLV
jgi:serine acetyltransferase